MNELKPEDVMRALECCITKHHENCCQLGTWSEEWNCMTDLMKKALALLRENRSQISVLKKLLDRCETQFAEKDAEIERLTKERDEARRDCAFAEQNHYECKKELEEMSDDILDSVRAERDRYKAESERYQSALLKRCAEHEYDYSNGWNEAITEFAERLKKFYSHLKGNTVGGSVEYHIDQIAKEMKEEQE